jgi:hypothetical protein
LTTVTDPRPVSGQETGRTNRPATGPINSHAAVRDPPSPTHARRSYRPVVREPRRVNHAHRSRQKGARRSPPAKTEDHANASRGDRSLFCRGARLGGYRRTHLSINLLLNLYSLVKEHLIAQAPPNAGESAVTQLSTDSLEFGYFGVDHRSIRQPELSQGCGI